MLDAYLTAHPELAAETLKVRAKTLGIFDRKYGLSAAGRAELESFLATPGWSLQTRASYRSHLRAYYRWAYETGLRADDPAATLRRYRVPRRLPRPLTDEQFTTLVACATGSLRTAVLLGGLAGLRCVEIAAVNPSTDVLNNSLYVCGKGGVLAMLPLHDLLAADLARYDGFVCPGDLDGHVSSQAVRHRIRVHMARCGVKATPHQLRHTFGINVYTNTRDLRLTQELMRHASPATTAVYTLVSDESRRAAIRSLRAV